MRKYRIELESLGEGSWAATLEKNHGTEDQPEWWGLDSCDGSMDAVFDYFKGEVLEHEKKM